MPDPDKYCWVCQKSHNCTFFLSLIEEIEQLKRRVEELEDSLAKKEPQ